MRKSIVFLLLLVSSGMLAQSISDYYRLPIDGEFSISANYGELRNDHFHAGIDIRVGGVVGKPIYAVADGYVSRIGISPYGYGKVVYITHPNGTTSVYAHLHTFSPAIKTYIETIQYARQRFAVNEMVESGILPIKKGQKIGTAGNSGSSGGPHLHFEIRETSLQIPLNIFAQGYYKVPTDNQPPTIRSVSFFSYSQIDSIPHISLFHQQTKPPQNTNQIISVSDTFFVGVDVIDTQNGTPAKLAIANLSVALDKEIIFACSFDSIAFNMSRYVNSAIVYSERIRNNQTMLKTFIEPDNNLSIYQNVKNNGLIILQDTLPHQLQIKATDDAGNTTVRTFTVQKKENLLITKNLYSPPSTPVFWNQEKVIAQNGLQVTIPAKTLYNSVALVVDSLEERPANAYSPLWNIHTPETPLHQAITIRINTELPEELKTKAVLAGINNKGKIYSAGGRWNNDAIEANIRNFGRFFVTIDSIPPSIKPRFVNSANLTKQSQLKIKITDELSGIATYTAYIDDQWALFEYDAKNDLLVYTFDSTRIKRNKKHKLMLTVTDNKQNTNSLQIDFTW